jgi:FADH2 O2-dependent halogenase
VSGLFEVLSRYERRRDPAEFAAFETAPYRGVQAVDFEPYQAVFELAAREVEAVGAGVLGTHEAAGRIYEHIRASGLSPAPWRLEDAARRCPGTFTLMPMLRLVAWGRYRSPPEVRRHYFRVGRALGLLSDLARTGSREVARSGGAGASVFRDSLVSWTDEWRTAGSARIAAAAAAAASRGGGA